MPTTSTISTLILAWLLATTFVACGQTPSNKTVMKQGMLSTNRTYDTSTTAIIKLEKSDPWLFDSAYKAAELTQDELLLVDSLLLVSVANYNNSLDDKHKGLSIDLAKTKYRKQLVVVTNSNGQKEVWVNCFCGHHDNERWKTEVVVVDDGGNCFFNFRINLATTSYFDFMVNGLG